MKAICAECGRSIGLTLDGKIYPHGGRTGSGYRCPGSMKEPVDPKPLTEVLKDMAESYVPALGPQVTEEVALGSQMLTRMALKAPGAAPALQLGDRVIRQPDGPHGVVTAIDSERAFVHWGTTMVRDTKGNQIENRFEDWVPVSELKLSTEPVYYGTVAEKNREAVWTPEARGNG